MYKTFLTVLLGCWSLVALGAANVDELQHDWAVANYELVGDAQVEAFEALGAKADAAVAANPGDAGLLIWQGIIKSTWAGKAGGLSALSLVKAARESLEKALEIDDRALDGSAYTSLGALYYQVPGWPIAFGSDKKARQLLEAALRISPDGIDSNYFYGDFLFHQAEYKQARGVLKKALDAPARPDRPLADTGRRSEIQALLSKIDKEMT